MNEKKPITPEMEAKLREPFPANVISKNDGKPYLSSIKAMAVIDRLNNVLGVGRWNTEFEIIEDTPDYVTVLGTIVSLDYDIVVPRQFGGHKKTGKGTEPADGYKSAVTDMITKCASFLRVGIDVFMGIQTHKNGGKLPVQQPQPNPTPEKPKPNTKRMEEAANRIKVIEAMPKRDKNAMVEYVMSAAIWLAWGREGDDLKKLAELTSFEGSDSKVSGFSNYGSFSNANEKRVRMAYLEAGRRYNQAQYGGKLKEAAEKLRKTAGTDDALTAILAPTDYAALHEVRKYADVADIGKKIKLATEIAEAYASVNPKLREEALTAHGYALAPFDYEWKKGIEAVTEKFGEIMNTMTELANQYATETAVA